MPGYKLSRTLWPAIAALVLVFLFFELTHVDLWVQDFFFNFRDGTWMVDQDAPVPKWIFYIGTKRVIMVISVALLILAIGPRKWLDYFKVPDPARRRLAVVILTVIITPLVVAQLKHSTYVACPWDIQRYGGEVPYLKVIEPYPPGTRPDNLSTSFPAAHPSGGFALMALAGLALTRRRQFWGLSVGMGLGVIMGIYQMAKGAHYLSHVVITWILAWIIFLLLQKLIVRRSP